MLPKSWSNASVEGYSRWDCPFHFRTSLLLSDFVISKPVSNSFSGIKFEHRLLLAGAYAPSLAFVLSGLSSPLDNFVSNGVANLLPSKHIIPHQLIVLQAASDATQPRQTWQSILYSQLTQSIDPLHLKSLFSISFIFSINSVSSSSNSSFLKVIDFFVFPSRK